MLPILLALATQTHIALAPWRGSDLPTSSASAVKFRLTLSGKPGDAIELRTSGVSKGWIAAFCDSRICSPNQVRETIPAGGRVVLQFELIREDESAPRSSGALINSSDGASVRVTPRNSS